MSCGATAASSHEGQPGCSPGTLLCPTPPSRISHTCLISAESSNSFSRRAGRPCAHRVQHALRLLVGLVLAVAAELDEQPGVAAGQQLRVALEALLQLVLDEPAVELSSAIGSNSMTSGTWSAARAQSA